MNLFNKIEIVGFLKYCNVNSQNSKLIVELRRFARTAIKNM